MYKMIIAIVAGVMLWTGCSTEVAPKYDLAAEIPQDADYVGLLDLAQWYLPAPGIKDEVTSWWGDTEEVPMTLLNTLVNSESQGGVNMGGVMFWYQHNTNKATQKITYLIPIRDEAIVEQQLKELELEVANNQTIYQNWRVRWTPDMIVMTNKKGGGFPSEKTMMEHDNFRRYLSNAQTLSFWTTSVFFQKELGLASANEEYLSRNYIHQHLSFATDEAKSRLELVTTNGVNAHVTLYLKKGAKRDFTKDFTNAEPAAIYPYTLSIPKKGQSSTFKIALRTLAGQMEEAGIDYDALLTNLTGEMAVATYGGNAAPEIAMDCQDVKVLAPILEVGTLFGLLQGGYNPNDFRIDVGASRYALEIVPRTVFLRKGE